MFVLKWKGRTLRDGDYFTGGIENEFSSRQKDAKRFETRAQAYHATDASVYYGAGGKYDSCGWIVVQLVKKKAKR